MLRHDSLNLRKEVALPINYEGTLSSCRDKLGSMRLVSYMTLWHVELSHIQFLQNGGLDTEAMKRSCQ